MSSILNSPTLDNLINSPFYDFFEQRIFRIENPHEFKLVEKNNIISLLGPGNLIAHEIIPADEPCRLFFDIDFSATFENFWQLTFSILHDLKNVLNKELKK